jgi:transmembrane sensor
LANTPRALGWRVARDVEHQSRISGAMAAERCFVSLGGGEAWFRVALNKKRPFVVEAGEIRAKAVGTAFSVGRRREGADVLITEGTIETWVVGREARRRVSTGSREFVSEAQPGIEDAAGQPGNRAATRLALRRTRACDELLGYAVGEINR